MRAQRNPDVVNRLRAKLTQIVALRSGVNPVKRLPCIYEGAIVEFCKSCGNGDDRHVRQCYHPTADRDFCTRNHPKPVYQNCSDCKDFVWPTAPVEGKRHLLYYVYPLRGPRWSWNLEMLARYRSIFNGKIVVAVATDAHSEGVAEVRDELEKHGIYAQILEFPNDPGIGEVVAWKSLWEQVLPAGPGDIAFYAHAKGVKHSGKLVDTTLGWTQILYEANLGHAAMAIDMLSRFPIVGCFKKFGRGFTGSVSSWHYSGTFFWARCADVATRNWQHIDKIWAGTEAWPGVVFKQEEGGCMFHAAVVRRMNLYSPNYMTRTVLPAWRHWIAGHVDWKVKTQAMLETVSR